ncbi:hypothetical protein BC830DRAFT_1164980 [Chytriomyces sp. MP71]|nr:hypothetical protein BC830DRAFT_1164980 [Chytriomyces sp. MP71]
MTNQAGYVAVTVRGSKVATVEWTQMQKRSQYFAAQAEFATLSGSPMAPPAIELTAFSSSFPEAPTDAVLFRAARLLAQCFDADEGTLLPRALECETTAWIESLQRTRRSTRSAGPATTTPRQFVTPNAALGPASSPPPPGVPTPRTPAQTTTHKRTLQSRIPIPARLSQRTPPPKAMPTPQSRHVQARPPSPSHQLLEIIKDPAVTFPTLFYLLLFLADFLAIDSLRSRVVAALSAASHGLACACARCINDPGIAVRVVALEMDADLTSRGVALAARVWWLAIRSPAYSSLSKELRARVCEAVRDGMGRVHGVTELVARWLAVRGRSGVRDGALVETVGGQIEKVLAGGGFASKDASLLTRTGGVIRKNSTEQVHALVRIAKEDAEFRRCIRNALDSLAESTRSGAMDLVRPGRKEEDFSPAVEEIVRRSVLELYAHTCVSLLACLDSVVQEARNVLSATEVTPIELEMLMKGIPVLRAFEEARQTVISFVSKRWMNLSHLDEEHLSMAVLGEVCAAANITFSEMQMYKKI